MESKTGTNGAVKVLDTVQVKDGRFTVNVGVGKGTPSSTGKSLVHVSTGGFKAIEGTPYSYSLLVISKVK